MGALPPSSAFAVTATTAHMLRASAATTAPWATRAGWGTARVGAGRGAACRPPEGRRRDGISLLTRNTLSSSDERPGHLRPLGGGDLVWVSLRLRHTIHRVGAVTIRP